jgi:hypothetical protein
MEKQAVYEACTNKGMANWQTDISNWQSKSSVCTKGQRHKDIPYHACQHLDKVLELIFEVVVKSFINIILAK